MHKRKVLVPLLSVAILFPTAANVYAEAKKPVQIKSVEFVGMEAPDTNEERSKMYSEASAVVTYNDGSQQSFPLEYKSLSRPGEIINGKVVGAAYDVNGNVITDGNSKIQ